jgi:phosphate acyltransferase
MKIVLDAMGSDHCPVPDVEGAVLAARESGDTIILVGDKVAVER